MFVFEARLRGARAEFEREPCGRTNATGQHSHVVPNLGVGADLVEIVMSMSHFLEVYGALPRAGPGSEACTRRAFAMLGDLPAAPRIIDVGCGPGAQTIDLLAIAEGTVVAVDLLPLMVERTRARAERAGFMDRLEVVEQDMLAMTFEPASFDVLWCEAAIYNLGFVAGLRTLTRFVRPGGAMVVSEAVWLKADPPEPVVAFWAQYPEIDTVARKLAAIEELGLESLGHFIMPDNAWTESYYDPLEARVAELAKRWADDPEGLAVLQEAQAEVALFRRHAAYYGYAFFAIRV